MKRAIINWLQWDVLPFFWNPIRTVQQWFEPDPPLTKEDLEGLTEGEIRALRGMPDVEPASIYKEKK